jgi:hypothetical protein
MADRTTIAMIGIVLVVASHGVLERETLDVDPCIHIIFLKKKFKVAV